MLCVAVEALHFYEKESKERLKKAGEHFGKGVAKMPQAIEGAGKARDFAAKDFKVARTPHSSYRDTADSILLARSWLQSGESSVKRFNKTHISKRGRMGEGAPPKEGSCRDIAKLF